MYDVIASVYDQWMRHMDYPAIHDRVLALLGNVAEGKTVLDVCTGTGTVLVGLAERGATVTGLDRSAAMLDEAARKVELADVADRVSLQHCDVVGEVEWPPGPYDAVLCVGDSVNYFDPWELGRFIGRCSEVLSETGFVYFDANTVYKLAHVFANSTYAEDLDDFAYIWQNRLSDDGRSIDFGITLFKRLQENGAERWAKASEHHRQYLHEMDALLQSMRDVGLDEVSITEDFGGEVAPSPESWRWVVVARPSASTGQYRSSAQTA